MAFGLSVRHGRIHGTARDSAGRRFGDRDFGEFQRFYRQGKEQEDVQRLRNRGGSHDRQYRIIIQSFRLCAPYGIWKDPSECTGGAGFRAVGLLSSAAPADGHDGSNVSYHTSAPRLLQKGIAY